jgi:hypothetical protein
MRNYLVFFVQLISGLYKIFGGNYFMRNKQIRSADTLITSDKQHVPFLLACSFHGHLNYVRNFSQNSVVYWEFTPKETALLLINKYDVKLPLGVPEKDVIDATNIFWKRVYDAKVDY